MLKSLFRLVLLLVTALAPTIASAQADRMALPVEVVPIVPHPAGINRFRFNRDSTQFVSVGGEGTIKLWDVSTGALIRNFPFTDKLRAIAFSPNGQSLFFSVGGGSEVKQLDAASGKVLRSLQFKGTVLALSSDGTRAMSTSHYNLHRNYPTLAERLDATTADDRNVINIWDLDSGNLVRSFEFADPRSLERASLSRDGSKVLTVDSWNEMRLWDTATGQMIANLGERAADALELSPDGSRVLSTSVKNSDSAISVAVISVLDSKTGGSIWNKEMTSRARAHFLPNAGVLTLEDGEKLESASHIRVWSASYSLVRTIQYSGTNRGAVLAEGSPDGSRMVTADYDGIISLWDIGTGTRLRQFNRPTDRKYYTGVAVPSDAAHIFLSDRPSGIVWDTKNGTLERVVNDSDASAVAYSPDGMSIATGDASGSFDLRLWNATTGELIRTLKGHMAQVSALAFSPDGSMLLSGSDDKSVKLWDVTTGRLLHDLSGHTNEIYVVAFTPDGKRAISSSRDKTVRVWDIATGQVVHYLVTGCGELPVSMAISPNKEQLAVSCTRDSKLIDGEYKTHADSVGIWDLKSETMIRTIKATESSSYNDHSSLNSIAYTKDGTGIITGSWPSGLKIWNVANGQLIRSFSSGVSGIDSVFVSNSGDRLITFNDDTTVRVWNIATGELLATFLGASDSNWIVMTPEGFFAASSGGTDLVNVVRGLEIYPISQVFQSLYRPDLVREKLAGDRRGLVRQAAANLDLNKVIASGSAPDVKVTLPARGLARVVDSEAAVDAEINDRGGGIGRVEWRVNGVTSGIDNPAQAASGQPVRLTRSLALGAGENIIEVVAYNNANLIASAPGRITVVSQAPAPATGPSKTAPAPVAAVAANARLFVLAAGSDDYADPRLQLHYSVPDAKAMAQALADSGEGLYASVETRVLSNAEVTTAGLDAAFQDMAKKILPGDVFVLYLAGHGRTVDGRYYFVPQNFKIGRDFTDAAVDTAMRAQGVAQEQWQRWFASIPARKSVILFDTCESGTLTGDAGQTKSLEQGAANDRLAQATGRSIITASSGSTAALEGYHGHGLFTYNLLDALDRGDSDNSGTIEVSEVAAFVYAQVTAISERVFKQRQEPQMKITLNYPLTKKSHFLQDQAPQVMAETRSTYQLTQASSLQIKPGSGITAVRGLSAKTAVTVLKSEGGWSLIANQGKPIGYVATKDLAPVQ